MELKIPPVVVVALFAALMLAVTRLLPNLTWLIQGRLVVSAVLALLGGLVSLAGVLAFHQRRTTVNPMNPKAAATIVFAGPYRFTRNPMYVGFIFGLTDWAIFLSNLGAALLVLGCVLYLTQFQIKPEERSLLQKFGTPFADYMMSVRRWL